MEGGEGGGGECVDDGDVRDANDDVMMMMIAFAIIISSAWLNGTHVSQGEGDTPPPPPSIALIMSEMMRSRTPAAC